MILGACCLFFIFVFVVSREISDCFKGMPKSHPRRREAKEAGRIWGCVALGLGAVIALASAIGGN